MGRRDDLKLNWPAGDRVLADDLNNNFEYLADPFGGDGSDGALDTSSGAVNIDLNNVDYVVKQYTSINVATNNLTFTNQNANGTIIVLKSQGDVVLSSKIDAKGMGASAGNNGYGVITIADGGGTGNTPGFRTDGVSGTARSTANLFALNIAGKIIKVCAGAGGGTGGQGSNNNGSAGGAGGVGGNYNTYIRNFRIYYDEVLKAEIEVITD